MDILDHLQRAFSMTDTIVAGITPADLDRPTPCDQWDVGRLLAHTIGVLDSFAARTPNPAAVSPLADDFHTQFRASAAAALAAWSSPGALEGMAERGGRPSLPWVVFAGINLVDTFTHAWDLAQATGQQTKVDEDLAGVCLDTARRVVPDDARAIVGFDEALEIDPTEPASSRLAAFLGRPQSH